MYELGEKPLTAGRSPEADIVIYDERASRVHCGFRLWDGDFYVKDLKSKNGTLVNDKSIEVAKIRGGDIVRIGNTLLMVEDEQQIGTNTAIEQIGGQMQQGQGYSTILRQIVGDVSSARPSSPPVTPVVPPPEDSQHVGGELSESKKLGTGPLKVGGLPRKPVRITIRRTPPEQK